MQPYESSSDPAPRHGHVPAMRHPHGVSGAPGTSVASVYPAYPRSATPIYDALYAEYQRLFRALPGDRTGEEEMRFERFERVGRLDSLRPLDGGAWGEQPTTRRPARAALPPAPRDGHGYGL
ncbi:hypothetical protein RM572_24175 [Streptomyces sp. DSM 42041]|uniref:Uncharacterized protein n=1 Tax=Streptomyces hazeniae TaxID=3075538 RepID=A0ABU2NY05_9ACTN|nr:hypothetical protein [Streptomyces sp. DSM 42041]MDT0381864.1 hypothetical protein [Streptomyces sp. DSM 42041]